MAVVREYIDNLGRSPFARWFDVLDPQAAAKVTTALQRLEQGNLSRVKGVGFGVFEYTLDFGPATASTSAKTARSSSFYSVAEPRSGNRLISHLPVLCGRNTNNANGRRVKN